MFLACKTEDHPRALNDIIIAMYNIFHPHYRKQCLENRNKLRSKIQEVEANLMNLTYQNSVGIPSPGLESCSPGSNRSLSIKNGGLLPHLKSPQHFKKSDPLVIDKKYWTGRVYFVKGVENDR